MRYLYHTRRSSSGVKSHSHKRTMHRRFGLVVRYVYSDFFITGLFIGPFICFFVCLFCTIDKIPGYGQRVGLTSTLHYYRAPFFLATFSGFCPAYVFKLLRITGRCVAFYCTSIGYVILLDHILAEELMDVFRISDDG